MGRKLLIVSPGEVENSLSLAESMGASEIAEGVPPSLTDKVPANIELPYLYEEPQMPLADVQAQRIAEIKREAYNLLLPTDWYVIRREETDEPIPQEVLTYRAAVRAASNAAEDAVMETQTLEEALAVQPEWPGEPTEESVE